MKLDDKMRNRMLELLRDPDTHTELYGLFSSYGKLIPLELEKITHIGQHEPLVLSQGPYYFCPYMVGELSNRQMHALVNVFIERTIDLLIPTLTEVVKNHVINKMKETMNE